MEAVDPPKDTITEDMIKPKTFRKAWDHKDPTQKEKWRKAIRKEFKDMIS